MKAIINPKVNYSLCLNIPHTNKKTPANNFIRRS